MKKNSQRWSVIIIAIEGIDGSGKSTQAKALVERLIIHNKNAIYIRPVFFIIGENNPCKKWISLLSPRKVRTRCDNNRSSCSLRFSAFLRGALGYFYALFTYYILKVKFRDEIVICDRFFFQFFFDLFGLNARTIVRFFPKPDCTFYLHGDIAELYKRMESPYDKSVKLDYYRDVVTYYDSLSNEYSFIKIDASKPKEEVNEIIWAASGFL